MEWLFQRILSNCSENVLYSVASLLHCNRDIARSSYLEKHAFSLPLRHKTHSYWGRARYSPTNSERFNHICEILIITGYCN